ncbi:hypothetical protein B296_00047476, partial [Ensete ventricosum]
EAAAARERRFPSAAQPEIMRAAEKDDHYAAYVHDACRDAFRHLFGQLDLASSPKFPAFRHSFKSIKLLGQTLYYILTTGSGQQTLGEEYCDICQVYASCCIDNNFVLLLQGLTDCHRHQQDECFLLYTRLQFLILQKESGLVVCCFFLFCCICLLDCTILDVVKISLGYLSH